MPRKNAIDFDALRHRLAAGEGKPFWRSLNELAETPEFAEYVKEEFPQNADLWQQGTSRRRFLQLMAASFALAGASGCPRLPDEKIVPYVEMPEHIVPGKPLFFASALTWGGWGRGIVVESQMGRPTKIEGNRHHPASLGATDAFTQASLLTLYDPDRSQSVTRFGAISNFSALQRELRGHMQRHRQAGGEGLHMLSEPISSPTMLRQIDQLRQVMPDMQWHYYEPTLGDVGARGAELAFGQPLEPIYRFDQAHAVLALDADFLNPSEMPPVYGRQFMQNRKLVGSNAQQSMNRLYVVETSVSMTGAKADHRLATHSRGVMAVAAAVARQLGIEGVPEIPLPGMVDPLWIEAVVEDLRGYQREAGGGSLVIAGRNQPPVLHALACAINEQLGNTGTSVSYIDSPVDRSVGQLDSLRSLVDQMRGGRVETLILWGVNPVFDAPADFQFLEALEHVPFRVHMGLDVNETARRCHWHIPQQHALESWSDVRAFNGTASIIQPLIAPLYPSWSGHHLLAAMLDQPDASPYELVRETWREQLDVEDFEMTWEELLRLGIVPDTEAEQREVTLTDDWIEAFDPYVDNRPETGGGNGFEIALRPDPTIWDGRFVNNGWLQETPKPLTKLTWDNAALISPQAAQRLDVNNEDMIRLDHADRRLEVPVLVVPGLPDEVMTLYLGYGRTVTGRVGRGTGFNVYRLRPSETPWFLSPAGLEKTTARYDLATTQEHFLLEGRYLVRSGTLEQFRADPEHPAFMDVYQPPPASLLPPWPYEGYKWGMVIDQTACVGCNACVVACQAENNIPVVGKEQIKVGREMHWIRIDTYYQGDMENPETLLQPLPCMHCEKAPCELVCPVAATTHSDEGINEMTYNRCVGTRYCANNCPYKVRRFNFLEYNDYETPVLKLLRNPNVSVRSRGIMEKCTYCIQRINYVRRQSKKEDRDIRPGEMVTACQGACPTEAIHFGNLNHPDEEVTKLRGSSLNFAVLAELNTEPRTTYLASMKNPNARLAGESQAG